MQIIKYFILFLILVFSSMIGKFISKRYVYRLQELEEMKNTLNILKNKIKFTYEPIPDVFLEISKKIKGNVGKLFFDASKQMQLDFAGEVWEKCISNSNLGLLEDDKEALKSLGKLLGSTDIEGQISQIRLVNTFLDGQIEDATESRNKNEKMYKKLGVIVGLAVVIVLA